jgi:hypothetical protein
MPQSDRAWTLAPELDFCVDSLVLGGILLWSFYFKRHPEYHKERLISGRTQKLIKKVRFPRSHPAWDFLRKILLALAKVYVII